MKICTESSRKRSALFQILLNNLPAGYLTNSVLSEDQAREALKSTGKVFDQEDIEDLVSQYPEYREDTIAILLQEDIENAYRDLLEDGDKLSKLAKEAFGNYSFEGQLIQGDYDRVSLTNHLMFPLKRPWETCDHSFTDGTIDCPDCGKSVTTFIYESTEYLDFIA